MKISDPITIRSISIPRNNILVFFGCIILAFLTYGGNQYHELLQWDDFFYISNNPWITDVTWSHIGELFTEFRVFNWHPITWLSYIPEYYFFGAQAQYYITTNIVLHSINAFLLYLITIEILQKYQVAQKNTSGIVIAATISSFLFIVHPQHTESVIWIAERKDLLYSFFYMMAILSYIKFYKDENNTKLPFAPFILFILSIMSKSMAITLPLVLILLDIFLLDRMKTSSVKIWLKTCVLEKAHYYLVMLLIVVITLFSQEIEISDQPMLAEKYLIVVNALQHYIQSYFMPINLSPFHPEELLSSSLNTTNILFLLALITAIGWAALTRQGRLFWAFFFVSLLPVIGIVNFGTIAYADRYTYLPMAGFYVVTGYLFSGLLLHKKNRYVVVLLLVTLFTILGWSTRQYKETWATDLSLWEYTAATYPDISAKIHTHLGTSYYDRGIYSKSIRQYSLATRIDPQYRTSYYGLANIYLKQGNIEKYLEIYKNAAEQNPNDPWINLRAGDAFRSTKNIKQAIAYYSSALSLVPNFDIAILHLAELYIELGEAEKAILMIESSDEGLKSRNESTLLLAQAYLGVGRITEAREMVKKLESELGHSHQAVIAMKRLLAQPLSTSQ